MGRKDGLLAPDPMACGTCSFADMAKEEIFALLAEYPQHRHCEKTKCKLISAYDDLTLLPDDLINTVWKNL